MKEMKNQFNTRRNLKVGTKSIKKEKSISKQLKNTSCIKPYLMYKT